MQKKKLLLLAVCNVIGLLLFGSWYATEYQGFWFEIDKAVFYFFNRMLATNKIFLYCVAFVNLRLFDLVPFAIMLLIYYGYYRRANVEGKRWLFCIGVAMLASAVVMKQFDRMLPIDRVSASLYFDSLYHDVNFVHLLSGWPAKDSSGASFPGDHGMMLLIFVAYVRKYIGRAAFYQAVAVFLVFSLPRVMSGAHWFTDIAVGSLSFALVILSWLLLTPIADIFIERLEKFVPLRYFIFKR